MKRRLLVFTLVVLMLPGCRDSGDRVLVSKYLYDSQIAPPDRYDVVVFKFPEKPIDGGTPKNYIKRLLGLPAELIAIFFGRLYVLTHDGPGAPAGVSEEEWRGLTSTYRQWPPQSSIPVGVTEQEWQKLPEKDRLNPLELWQYPPKNNDVAKKLWDDSKDAEKQGKDGLFKILRKPPHVMLALSRPVFDNDHQAKDLVGILPERWAAQAGAAWAADTANGFKTDGAAKKEEWLRYRHILRPDNWPAKNALDRDKKILEIKTDPDHYHWPQLITDYLGYNTYKTVGPNGLVGHAGAPPPNWVGDLMLECKLTVDNPDGEFWMELSKGVDRFQARFDLLTGTCSLYRKGNSKADKIDANVEAGKRKGSAGGWELLGTAETRVKAKGEYQVRFANYDQRLTVWVGRELPFGHGKEYKPPTEFGPDGTQLVKADGLDGIKNNDLQPASLCSMGAAVQVHGIKLWRDTYYTGTAEPHTNDSHNAVLGDNWKDPGAWGPIQQQEARTIYVYPGHYLCLGDNSPESSDSRAWGLVPDRLMLGRALMVYFPFDRAGMIK